MTKNFKLVLALALVAMMIVSMIPAMADGEVTITVPSSDTHTYEVYQIFTGTVSSGNVLSDVRWGANGTGTVNTKVDDSVLTALEALAGKTDAEKATTIKTYANLSNPVIATLTKDTAEADRKVAPGYYLIKDKDSVVLAEGDEHTLYIVQVVDPVTIARKASTTTSDKKVDDVNDSDSTQNAANQTSSDYDIGDDVPYHLTATLSEKVEQYKTYKLTFSDVLESGKFDAISLSADDIKINGVKAADTENYTVAITGVDGATKNGFEVKLVFTPKEGKTLASLNSAVVTIDFTAKLGEGAAIGDDGNKNTLTVKYSSNPNDNQGGEEKPDTPHEVITFTYKVVVDKVDDQAEPKPLPGAGFTLYKVTKADAEAGVTGTDATAKNDAWATKQIKTWTTTAVAGTDGTTLNRFSFDGIDDGYYVLCETTTPTGYNTVDPQVFKVEATHGGTDGLTLTDLSGTKLDGSAITFTKDVGEGSLTATIQNNKGATLPETGGVGTTIFYVAGSIMVLAAAILLITKRRMGANE